MRVLEYHRNDQSQKAVKVAKIIIGLVKLAKIIIGLVKLAKIII